mgnify:CR=1 FL=1
MAIWLLAVAAILMVLLVIFSFILLVPFHLSLKLELSGLIMQTDYQIRWLWVTLKKGELPPPRAKDWKGEGIGKAIEKKKKEKKAAKL